MTTYRTFVFDRSESSCATLHIVRVFYCNSAIIMSPLGTYVLSGERSLSPWNLLLINCMQREIL